jgi:hypothetical protein
VLIEATERAAANEIHRRIFINSTMFAAGAMRQPMQNSMKSATSIRRLPDSLLKAHAAQYLFLSHAGVSEIP